MRQIPIDKDKDLQRRHEACLLVILLVGELYYSIWGTNERSSYQLRYWEGEK
jgi:hypothetical protein